MHVLYHIFIVISRKLTICTEKHMSLPPPSPLPPPAQMTLENVYIYFIIYNYNNYIRFCLFFL